MFCVISYHLEHQLFPNLLEAHQPDQTRPDQSMHEPAHLTAGRQPGKHINNT